MTPAGERDCFVRFERATIEEDDNGTEVSVWSLLEEAWVKPNYGRGEERRNAARENVSITATFRVLDTDLISTLTAKDRLVTDSDGYIWDITSVVPVDRFERDVTAIWSA